MSFSATYTNFLTFSIKVVMIHAMQSHAVNQLTAQEIVVRVPASKSVLNRALPLAAFTAGDARLACGPLCEDTRTMVNCLSSLGISIETTADGLLVHGGSAKTAASLDVGSAGTAARFLTAILAVRGGCYEMTASPQMQSRPMGLLPVLEKAGVRFQFHGEPWHFPFKMCSNGLNTAVLTVDTDESTQYASGLMLAAAVTNGLTLRLTGSRQDGSYLATTVSVLKMFHSACEKTEDGWNIAPSKGISSCEIEPDVSAACYFYALSLLLGIRVKAEGVHEDLHQADLRLLSLLQARGVRLSDDGSGVTADGNGIEEFFGFEEDMHDFSDQTLTLAALAPFAKTPSRLYGVAHIRKQESDRLRACAHNLASLGVPCEEFEDGITIYPAEISGGIVEPFGDHRVAMAFSLIGLKTGGITVLDPYCCNKTFEGYFDLLDRLTKGKK